MQIIYTQHIENRIRLREIEYDLPRRIVEQAEERYFDNATGHFIAIMKTELYNKTKEVIVAYIVDENCLKLLTIHPLKERQKKNRIASGRWRKI
jgi:hypothetical protein